MPYFIRLFNHSTVTGTIRSLPQYSAEYRPDIISCALTSIPPIGKRGVKERMWGYYHCLCTSSRFHMLWEHFSSAINEPASAFIQYVTHFVFKELIKIEFPTLSNVVPPMTHIEENALRYSFDVQCFCITVKL